MLTQSTIEGNRWSQWRFLHTPSELVNMFIYELQAEKNLPRLTFTIKWVKNINSAHTHTQIKHDRKLKWHRFRTENMNREGLNLQQEYIRMICPCAYRLFISTWPDGGNRAEWIRVVLLRGSSSLIVIPKLVCCHKPVRLRHCDQALSEIMRSLLLKRQQK